MFILGTVRTQNTLMKERVLYDNSKYLLFYSAEGGLIGEGGVQLYLHQIR